MCVAIQTLNERAANQERIETLKKSLKKLMGVTGWSIEKSMDAQGRFGGPFPAGRGAGKLEFGVLPVK